jgi:2-iminobutanoate/2-iminopropanoate deaminase
MTVRHAPRSSGLPTAAGPYSQVAGIGKLIAVSGQVGVDPATGQIVDGVTAQTRQALANLHAALAAAGAGPQDVLRVGVFLTDVRHFADVNEVYAEAFDAPYPARVTVYVGLPLGLLVEIDALAVLPGS